MSQSGAEDDTQRSQSESLSIFCREVRNLLRSKPNCMVPFSKFVPAYHNHYGRQCCVYQFGYTKLVELLESIPHVVQIIGEGTNRYITLTHREQIKRFASDLIKVVKSQPGKRLKLSQFAKAYEQVLGRTFRVQDYGTNNINVLLAEIWEGTINIMPIKRELADQGITGPLFVDKPAAPQANGSSPTKSYSSSSSSSCNEAYQLVVTDDPVSKPYITEQYPDAWFEIPKRERSDKEIKRTKYFVWDVIDLLSNMPPDYSVPFSKFIPSYHYYFNRQCKVSIFGFSKLIDLFESISPGVVEIVDQGPGEEKIIKLAQDHWPTNKSNNSRKPNGKRSNVPTRHPHHYNNYYDRATKNGPYRPSSCSPDASSGCGSADHSTDRIINRSLSVDAMNDNDGDEDDYYGDEDFEDFEDFEDGDDIILPLEVIDVGPTEQELMELEDELTTYEELKAIQCKRSARMAAILDIFKYSIC